MQDNAKQKEIQKKMEDDLRKLPPEYFKYIKEVSDLKTESIELWKKILSFDVTISEALRKKKLKTYEEEHRVIATKAVEAREQIISLGKLISQDDPKFMKKLADLMSKGLLNEMHRHEGELSGIMKDLATTLTDKRMEASYKRALGISIMAVSVSLISVIVVISLHFLQ